MANDSFFKIDGRELECLVCSSKAFVLRRSTIVSRMTLGLHLGFAGPLAVVAMCRSCGYVHWFVGPAAKRKRT